MQRRVTWCCCVRQVTQSWLVTGALSYFVQGSKIWSAFLMDWLGWYCHQVLFGTSWSASGLKQNKQRHVHPATYLDARLQWACMASMLVSLQVSGSGSLWGFRLNRRMHGHARIASWCSNLSSRCRDYNSYICVLPGFAISCICTYKNTRKRHVGCFVLHLVTVLFDSLGTVMRTWMSRGTCWSEECMINVVICAHGHSMTG